MDDKWRTIACGCSNGLKWGYDEPIECDNCDGAGTVWIRPTGHSFAYPGGPATGMYTKEDYKRGTPEMPWDYHGWNHTEDEIADFPLDYYGSFKDDFPIECMCGWHGSIKDHEAHAEEMKQQFIAEHIGV